MRSGHRQTRGKGAFEAKGHQESYNASAQPWRHRDNRFGDGNDRSPGPSNSGSDWMEKSDGYKREHDQRHGGVGVIATPSRKGGKGGSFRDEQWSETGKWNSRHEYYQSHNGNNGNNGSFFHQSPVPARNPSDGNTEKTTRGPVSELEECLRRKGVDEAWQLLEDMQANGIVADKYTVSRMLMKTVADGRSGFNMNKVYRGIGLVESFIDTQPADVDEVLFNALLDTCCRLRDIRRLEVINHKMRELKIKPSAVTLGILVKTYGQAGDLEKVLDVWNEMSSQRDHANAVTYGCMLDACIKCGDLPKAIEVFREMKAGGKHRNTILYTTLIKGYGQNRDLASSLALFEEMKAEGVACNTITYNSIIDVCVKCGDIRAAEGLMTQMMQTNEIEPDLITFSTLLKGYCQQNEVDKALHVFENIKQRGLKQDELVYNTLMDGCVKVNDLPTGVALFEEMLSAGLKPSAITHSILVRLYRTAGYDEAQEMVASLYESHRLERPQYNERDQRTRGGKGEKGGRDDWNRNVRGERSRDWEQRVSNSPGSKGKGFGRKGNGQHMDSLEAPQTPTHNWSGSRNLDESPFLHLSMDALISPPHDFLGTPNSGAATPVPGICTPGGSWGAFGPMNMGCSDGGLPSMNMGCSDGGLPINSPMNNMQCVPPLPGSADNTPCNGTPGGSIGGGGMNGSWFGMPNTGDSNMWGGQDLNSLNRSPLGAGMGVIGSNNFSNNQGSDMSPSAGPGPIMPPWPQDSVLQMPMNMQMVSVPMGFTGKASSSGNMGGLGSMSGISNNGSVGGPMGNMAGMNNMSNMGNMGGMGNTGNWGGMGNICGMGNLGPLANMSMEMGITCFSTAPEVSGSAMASGGPCNDPLPAVEAELLPNGLLEAADSPQDQPSFAGPQQQAQQEEQQQEEESQEQQLEENTQDNEADSLPASPDKRNCPTTPEQYASYPMPATPSPGGVCHDNALPMMGMNMMQQSQDQVQFMPDLQYGMAVGPQESAVAGQYPFGPVGPPQCQDLQAFGDGSQSQMQMLGEPPVWMQGCAPNQGQQMPNSYWGNGSECEMFNSHH